MLESHTACNCVKKRLQHRCFPLISISKNHYFKEHLRTTASKYQNSTSVIKQFIGVFRTHPNIYDAAFFGKQITAKSSTVNVYNQSTLIKLIMIIEKWDIFPSFLNNYQKQHRRWPTKKAILKNLTILTVKQLCQGFFLINLQAFIQQIVSQTEIKAKKK